jgi:SAM-dependent methyltransferase
MSLSDEYRRQFGWRPWPRILDALPALQGQRILDLGCGPGDLAAELVARGARVIGIDVNEELLRQARSKSLAGAEFRQANLREPLDLGANADGLRCSSRPPIFPTWRPFFRPGRRSSGPEAGSPSRRSFVSASSFDLTDAS